MARAGTGWYPASTARAALDFRVLHVKLTSTIVSQSPVNMARLALMTSIATRVSARQATRAHTVAAILTNARRNQVPRV